MKKLTFKSIRSRLTFWFLIIALMPLFIGIILTYYQDKIIIRHENIDKLVAIRDLKVQQLNYWLDERVGDLKAIAKDYEVRTLGKIFDKKIKSPEDIKKMEIARKLMFRYLEDYDAYVEAFIINAHTGIVEISTKPKYEGMDKSNDTYFTKPLKTNEIFIKDIYYAESTGHIIEMTFSIPIFCLHDDPTHLIGIMVMRIDLSNSLYPLLKNKIGLGQTGETLIVNKNVMALNELRGYKNAPLNLQISAKPAISASQGKTGIVSTNDYKNEEVLAAYTYIPRTEWGFVCKQNISELEAPIHELIKNLTILLIVSVTIVVLIVLWISKLISKPIKDINIATQKIINGNYSVKVPVNSRDELGSLAHSINEMAVSIESNIAAKKKQYIKLKLQKKETDKANKELETFAYSVSHDLRAPLRAIDGFTRILIEDHVSKLNEEGKRFGAIIQDNTKKMSTLIDDLLTFSRMGRASISYTKIDMKSMVIAMYNETTNAEERNRIKFTVDDLPTIYGDTNLMRQAWINLISNAIKFTSYRKQAIISISCQKGKNQFTYCIKDNGSGFNKKYQDKLFTVFQRLHNQEKFKGNGIGLALVQRIISRHNGEIWAESEIDKGAVFYFNLPKNRGAINEKQN